jgi:hypothetical protein
LTGVKLLLVSLILILGAFAVIRPVGAILLSTLTASGDIEVVAGASGHTTLTFTHAFQNGASIICSDLPLGAGYSPSSVPGSINIGDSFQLTVSTSSSTPPGTYPIPCGAAPSNPYMISPVFGVSSRGLSNGAGSLGPQSISIQQLPPPTFNLIVDPAPIPEYPLGLPLLAIFLIFAYGLIRRKTAKRPA